MPLRTSFRVTRTATATESPCSHSGGGDPASTVARALGRRLIPAGKAGLIPAIYVCTSTKAKPSFDARRWSVEALVMP